MSPRVQLGPGWNPSLLGVRALVVLLLVLPLVWWCQSRGYGFLALAVVVFGAWPYRYRVTTTSDAVEIAWLFLRARIARSSLTGVELAPDRRRWLIGPRQPVLRITRSAGRDLVAFGPERTLRQLQRALTAAPY
jgi:hypothetical protein